MGFARIPVCKARPTSLSMSRPPVRSPVTMIFYPSAHACSMTEAEFRAAEVLYIELQPVTGHATPGALAITGLSMEVLADTGRRHRRRRWSNSRTGPSRAVPVAHRPVFVALNAPFDWMFVNDYFHRCLQRIPFGHSALDIKAFYMGMTGVHWAQTSMRSLAGRYLGGRKLTHHALQDAKDQAEIFFHILAEARARFGAMGSGR